jgi:hypothetical protein
VVLHRTSVAGRIGRGTNNEELLNDKFYWACSETSRGVEYFHMVDEFMVPFAPMAQRLGAV